MVKSNTITITVKSPVPDIKEHTLTADRTEIFAGEYVVFSGKIVLVESSEYNIVYTIDVFVDDQPVDSFEVTLVAGRDSVGYQFRLTFDAPGTYSVYTDALVKEYG
jgi:hypothetical protein